jgi:hypothetical protein
MIHITHKSTTDERERFCRSLDYAEVAGKTEPYALLAAAVIAQAAVDCSEWTPEAEKANSYDVIKKGVNCRFARLRDFINSDWIDLLLCWQHEVTPDAVREELVRRLTT